MRRQDTVRGRKEEGFPSNDSCQERLKTAEWREERAAGSVAVARALGPPCPCSGYWHAVRLCVCVCTFTHKHQGGVPEQPSAPKFLLYDSIKRDLI